LEKIIFIFIINNHYYSFVMVYILSRNQMEEIASLYFYLNYYDLFIFFIKYLYINYLKTIIIIFIYFLEIFFILIINLLNFILDLILVLKGVN